MSVELLRRAAARLRLDVERLPGAMADRPWRFVVTDSGDLYGVAACVETEHDCNDAATCDSCWNIQTPHAGAAAYIRRMYPPVALAVADWLDDTAELVADGVRVPKFGALTVARAVLREGTDG